MIDNTALYDQLDKEILSCIPAVRYAEEHIESIISSAYQNCVRKVYTTDAYELGIACPSLVNHRVTGGLKRGRVIKQIPENDSYSEIGYGSDGKPLYFKDINTFGTEINEFFFDYDGYTWVMRMELCGMGKITREVSTYNIKKYRYDEKGRIHFYAEMNESFTGPDELKHGSIIANVYEYPENAEEPVLCHYYYYVMDIFKRHEHPRFFENLYEISPDLKIITEYSKKENGELVFSRQISSGRKRSSKPRIESDSFNKFSQWLDSELEREIPDKGGIYFDLFEPTEDGFGIFFCITEAFTSDDDEWACDVSYSSEQMLMVKTNGQFEWEDALNTAVKLIKKYLTTGKRKDILRKYDGIGTGFSDGDVEYIYVKKQ